MSVMDDQDHDVITRCDVCAEECSTTVVDMGIGAYEYWGARGVDRQLVRVSSCCEGGFTCYDRDEEPEDVEPGHTDTCPKGDVPLGGRPCYYCSGAQS